MKQKYEMRNRKNHETVTGFNLNAMVCRLFDTTTACIVNNGKTMDGNVLTVIKTNGNILGSVVVYKIKN